MSPKFSSNIFQQIEREVKVAYIATYPPKECGIATFTKDLTNAINMLNPHNLARIFALNHGVEKFVYPWEVLFEINNTKSVDFIKAAQYINQSNIDIVNIQHEYGIFGVNDSGIKILEFINALKKPMVTTIHTTLINPTETQMKILSQLWQKSQAIISLSKTGVKRLNTIYNIQKSKIVHIPHGIPDIPLSLTETYKTIFGYSGKNVIGVHGLLSPGKGYEYVIKAMPKIIKKHPNTIFVIAGATHPEVKKKQGESYREELIQLATRLGVQDHIYMYNEYMSLDTVINFIRSFDIYVTPYKNPEQIVSGCLAYAIGCGKATVSTPYIYAKEVLDHDKGIIVDFGNYNQFAKEINNLLDKPELREQLALESYRFARTMTWVNVASKYLDLFTLVKQEAYETSNQLITPKIIN